ncbi:hypothetical protein K443DRAFT_680687 [Laccaria amethystina LaAM-08-1]|uniref:Uncharacterized protein n=2 Tax=Laccaria amethystina LaAM-08-1 TaxID=1095629 RepID=A0A0C9WMX3_9AGAR|nr:hypothetical protein K443DRAFT_680687 [Laccaria amethystina LaAM-08-1]
MGRHRPKHVLELSYRSRGHASLQHFSWVPIRIPHLQRFPSDRNRSVGTSYDHTFDVRGGAVGTFKMATGQADATDGVTGFGGLLESCDNARVVFWV